MTSPLTSPSPTLGVPKRPMARSTNHALVGGVCAGLAVRLGIRERTVRIAFSLVTLLYGAGLLIYVVLWLFVRRWGEDSTIAQQLTHSRRQSHIILISLLAALLALFALGNFARHGTGTLSWSLFLGAVALAAVWFGSSRDERNFLEGVVGAVPIMGAASARGWRAFLLRLVPGVLLVVVGLRALRRIGGVWGGAVPAILGAGVLALGMAVLLAPWWLDNVRDLSRERRERVRIEERAKLVTHVHDSVLQTLTLIEKAADSPYDVRRLARAQERELRQWLFAPERASERDDANGTFAQQLRRIESDVENDYGVTIELVVVGDCDGDNRVAALAAATREAVVNAAKWAHVTRVSVFGEVETASLSVYVRDTGVGFDLEHIADDRHGINHSIIDRMTSHGGQAEIRSVAGTGTEVHLSMARAVLPA
jgi:signal transduction histidine kinase